MLFGMDSASLIIYVFLVLLVTVSVPVNTCWAPTAPEYGNMTMDYDLLENEEMVLNCTLKQKKFPDIQRMINSSDIVFEKSDFTNFTHITYIIDELTAQMRIPNAMKKDSGMYYCKIKLPSEKKLVCGSIVSVGYPPQPIKNFSCFSLNFDNLTCTWDVEKNGVATKYTVLRSFMGFEQICPLANSSFCQWSRNTDTVFQIFETNFTINVTGNNSLGVLHETFSVDLYEIVILNSPENFKVVEFGEQYIKLHWEPPKMDNIRQKPHITYQLFVKDLANISSNGMFIDVGNDVFDYTVENLIPFISYNVSVRCRSAVTFQETSWSVMNSLIQKTLPDVPYEIPETIPEAFDLHSYENSRYVTLYWKPVPLEFHNGKDFYHHIEYYAAKSEGNSTVFTYKSVVSHAYIEHLRKDSQYVFHIYSANEKGLSKKFSTIVVNAQKELLPGPSNIRAISHDVGSYYNLSWTQPEGSKDIHYIVFWCSVRPMLSRCDGSIYWMNIGLKNNIVLPMADTVTNLRFAVVAKNNQSSSGMKWAPCIVPNEAALSKIDYVRINEKNSSALNVIWKLDCPAQRALVWKFKIQYCRISTKEECKVATVEPNAESYLLHDLHPFSNYSIKIKAINKENNLTSEDSEPIYQNTLQGAPSDPPRNITLLSKSDSSFRLRWLPPLIPNGIITRYVVTYNDFSKNFPAVQDIYDVEINRLNPFTHYSVKVKACVNNDCSVESSPIVIETDITNPGIMEPPRLEAVNGTHLRVSWSKPNFPNGPIDFYEIRWLQNGENQTTHFREIREFSEELFINLECSKLKDFGIVFLFYIRAVNVKNGNNLYGQYSQSSRITACIMPQGVAMIIGIAIGGTLALGFFLLCVYKLVKWMKEKIHQVKSITIRLPKGLDGPETNPLNNYESFKNGLVQNISPNKTERLSYIIDETDKNRHGSGSSQYSNTSTDELIFKNGKCTKFGRKPSGDSSGCSSMSSNTTPRGQLSSDSGTESDFMVSPSSDSLLTEQNNHKTPLPILIERHDSLASEQTPPDFVDLKPIDKGNNLATEMLLKIDHPYSKFGISGNAMSISPSRVNPLVFYSCNLANSEPSVFDIQCSQKQKSEVLAPYSKIGLAKSSGDILNIPCSEKQMGYSKFGFTPDIPINSKNIAINLGKVEGLNKIEFPSANSFLSTKKSFSNSENSKELPNHTDGENFHYFNGFSCNPDVKKSSPGYVPFNDIRNMKEIIPTSPLMSSADPTYLFKSNSFANLMPENINVPCHSSVWTTSNYFGSEGKDINLCMLGEDSSPTTQIYNYPKTENKARILNGKTHSSLPLVRHCKPFISLTDSASGSIPSSILNVEQSCNKTDNSSDCSYNPVLIDSSKINNNNLLSNQVDCLKFESPYCNTQTTAQGNKHTAYVPFSILTDTPSDKTVEFVPNLIESNATLCNEVNQKDHNYVTPSNKSGLKVLQSDSESENDCSKSHCNDKDSFNCPKKHENEVGYLNNPLKFILKPLPTMESEICEV